MKHLLLVFFILGSSATSAQSVSGTFNAAFQQFQDDADFKHATIGLLIQDLKSGKPIISQNVQTGLAPASTQKIITAASAYALLGKDFRYETKIGYTGKIENGKLHGNIVIKGSGDPTLGSWRYGGTKEQNIINEIVAAVLQAGINEIDGHVLVDEALFDDDIVPDGWIWQDMGNYYGAGARALNWRENQFDLYLKSGATVGSDVAIAGTSPAFIAGLAIRSELKSAAAGTGDNAYIYPSLFDQSGSVRGTVPVNQKKFTISGALPDAAKQLAITIEAVLKKKSSAGVAAEYPASAAGAFDDATELHHIESPSLDSICYWFLQKSINLYGEALLKTLGQKYGAGGTTSEGVKIIRNFWKKQGIDTAALNIMDGSGLSPQNRVTPDVLVKVLLFSRQQPWFSDYFNGFPVISGIKMKSGSINGVISYTGIINGKGGDYVFAFIVNNYSGSGAQVRRKMWKLLGVLK